MVQRSDRMMPFGTEFMCRESPACAPACDGGPMSHLSWEGQTKEKPPKSRRPKRFFARKTVDNLWPVHWFQEQEHLTETFENV